MSNSIYVVVTTQIAAIEHNDFVNSIKSFSTLANILLQPILDLQDKRIIRTKMLEKQFAYLLAGASIVLGNGLVHNGFTPKKFTVNLSAGVPRMIDLVRETRLPSNSEFSGFGNSSGIALDVLESLRTQWLEDFNWDREEAALNK